MDNYSNPITGRTLPTPPNIGGPAQAAPDVGNQVLQLLKNYQTQGKVQLYNAQTDQANRLIAPTSPDLIGASPSQQNQVRSASVNAMEPTIGGARSLVSEAGSVIDRFNQEIDKAKDDARQTVKDAITTFGSKAFSILDPKIIEQAGYNKDQIATATQSLKEQEIALKAAANAGNDSANNDLAQSLVDGTLDPSQLSKRTTNYNAVLSQANALSMQQTGKPFNVAQASIDYKYANQPNTQNTLNYLGSLIGGPGQTGNLDELVNLSNSISRTNFPALNQVSNWTKLQAGSPQIAAYYAVATEVADQVAKILAGGGTGNSTSDAKLNQALSLFQSSFSKQQLIATVNALKPLLLNRAKNMIGTNRYLQASYGDRLGINSSSSGSGSSGSGETKTVNGIQYQKVPGGWKKISFNSVGNTSASI